MKFAEHSAAVLHKEHHHRHNHQLIERIPRFHIEGLEQLHQKFVVQTAHSPQQHAGKPHPEPSVRFERKALFMADKANPQQRHEAQHNAHPL